MKQNQTVILWELIYQEMGNCMFNSLKMLITLDNDTIALGWNFYNIPVNENNCSFLRAVDVASYGMWTYINTPSELIIEGIYSQFWEITKTSKKQN